MRLPKPAFALFIALVSASCSFAGDQSLDGFWREFRAAVVSGRNEDIAGFVRFPLSIHGVTDDEPVQQCDRKCFETEFPKLLEQVVYVPAGEGVDQRSMKALIQAQSSVEPDLAADELHFRFRQFVFSKAEEGWRLTDAYLEE